MSKELGAVLVKVGVVLLMVIPAWRSAAQQKVQFSQYMFNSVVINPAYTGADEALSLTFINRSQWTGVEKAPSTQSLSAHTLFGEKHMGLGLTLINDQIGVHKNLDAMANYAYHLKTGDKSYLSMGLQAGVHNRRSDYASLAGTINNDPKLYNPLITHTFIDFGMGVYFRSPRFHWGVSAPELIPQRIVLNDTLSVQMSKVNFFIFSKYRLPLNETTEVEPSVLIKYFAGVPVSFDINMNFVFRKVLTLGLSYRKRESIDFLLKAQLTPQLQFGYSYDYPIGEISRLSSGSHEIMVNYLFRYVRSNVTSPR